MGVRTLLNIGCGPKGGALPREFAAYKEVRLDLNPLVDPDIVASAVAMPMIEDESYDGAYAKHVLEHLYFHEAAQALKEICRVLKPEGIVRIDVPDLQSIGSAVALDKADFVIYSGGMGPVSPLDMLYGHRGSVAAGNLFMAHKMGYTASVLIAALRLAGFEKVEIDRDVKFELVARARKPALKEEASEEAMLTSANEVCHASAV